MLIDNICFSPSSTIRQQCWSQRTWRRWSKYPSSDPGQPRTPRCLEHPYLSCRTGAWWRTGCPWCSGGWWSTCAGMVRKVCGDLLAAPRYRVFYSLSAIQEEEPHWSYPYHNLGVVSFVCTHFPLLCLIPFKSDMIPHNSQALKFQAFGFVFFRWHPFDQYDKQIRHSDSYYNNSLKTNTQISEISNNMINLTS